MYVFASRSFYLTLSVWESSIFCVALLYVPGCILFHVTWPKHIQLFFILMGIGVHTVMGAHEHAFLLSIFLSIKCWITGSILVDNHVSQSGCADLLPTSCVELWLLHIFKTRYCRVFNFWWFFRWVPHWICSFHFLDSELSIFDMCIDYLHIHLYRVPFQISCPFISCLVFHIDLSVF